MVEKYKILSERGKTKDQISIGKANKNDYARFVLVHNSARHSAFRDLFLANFSAKFYCSHNMYFTYTYFIPSQSKHYLVLLRFLNLVKCRVICFV